MLKKIIFSLATISIFTVNVAAADGGVPPKSVSDYQAIARPDAYSGEQLWSEYFTLPSGISAYATTDLAEKGLTFTYTNSNPALLTVKNCGFDPTKSYRNNNVTWELTPMTTGEAILSISCTYEGVTTTATRKFIVEEVPDNPFTPKATITNVNNVSGIHTGAAEPTAVKIYTTSFFDAPAGWNVPANWEGAGVTWGAYTDNPTLIPEITTQVTTTSSSSYGQIDLKLANITDNGTLTVWFERNGVRKEASYPVERYMIQCVDDVLAATRTEQENPVDVLANDKKSTAYDVVLSVVRQPKFGKITESEVEDWRGNKSPALAYTPTDVENIENWATDTFRYRATLVDKETGAEGEYAEAEVNVTLRNDPTVARVFEFVPAPGQFVNSSGFTTGEVLIGVGAAAGSSSLPSTSGMISLGGFGGYVVVGFDGPVNNDPRNPYGVDFTIGGNAFEANAKGYWSEPGAVMVMRDDNGNGLPDDTWYELAGSNYWFKTSRRNVTFNYEDLGYSSRYYIPYTASDGLNGAVPSNQFHSQNYFPDPALYPDVKLNGNILSLTGTHINAVYDLRVPSYIECYRPLGFGYCDNHATNGDLTLATNPYYADDNGKVRDGFDISWAIDSEGNYVDLDHIDFIKVYNSVNQACGWLGESSTEVAGIAMTKPDLTQEAPGDYYLNYAGITQLQVVEGHTCQFEGFAFKNGRPMFDAEANWTSSDETVGTIDNTGLFTALKTGTTTLTFRATELAEPDVFEVEVVTLSGVEISREGYGSTASNTEGTALVGEHLWFDRHSITTNTDELNGSQSNHYIYDTYTWTSSDPEVASIDKNGYLEALKTGETVLTMVSDTDPTLSTTFTLTVIDLPEIQQYNNYLAIEDDRMTQEELNAKHFADTDIFAAQYKDGNVAYKKRVNLSIAKIEPEGHDDAFYIKENHLFNNLTKGDWREYIVTIEGSLGDEIFTLELPILHTSGYNTVNAPVINEGGELLVDPTTKNGELDLNEIFALNGIADIYSRTYRIASSSPELPEGYNAELNDNLLSLTLDEATEFATGHTIDIECRVQRISQRKQAPGTFTPQDSYTWNKATIGIGMGESTTGINEINVAKKLIISPNPVTYGFKLNIGHTSAVKIYSNSGMRIFSGEVAPGEMIDVRALPSGLYLVEVAGYPVAKLIKK